MDCVIWHRNSRCLRRTERSIFVGSHTKQSTTAKESSSALQLQQRNPVNSSSLSIPSTKLAMALRLTLLRCTASSLWPKREWKRGKEMQHLTGSWCGGGSRGMTSASFNSLMTTMDADGHAAEAPHTVMGDGDTEDNDRHNNQQEIKAYTKTKPPHHNHPQQNKWKHQNKPPQLWDHWWDSKSGGSTWREEVSVGLLPWWLESQAMVVVSAWDQTFLHQCM